MDNPFRYAGVVTGTYFADRKREIAELSTEMKNTGKVFLVSPRRYGKTCLIFNLKEKLTSEGLSFAYLDLNAYPDLASFSVAITEKICRILESSTEKLTKLVSVLRYLRPRVEVSPDGALTAGVELNVPGKDALAALLEGLHYSEQLAKKKNRKIVVAIDEFSELEKYDGQTLEKAIRSEIQTHTHIGYIFSGSAQSVMLAMVRDPKRAFYRMGRTMQLGPIERAQYREFICSWLKKGGYDYGDTNFDLLFDAAEDVPYNVQRMCNLLWEMGRDSKKITDKLLKELPSIVARQDSAHFELIWQTVSRAQRVLLIALAKEPDAKPFSRQFQLDHGIGPSSSIKASLDSLVKKGILYRALSGKYKFSDTFMRHWILSLTQN